MAALHVSIMFSLSNVVMRSGFSVGYSGGAWIPSGLPSPLPFIRQWICQNLPAAIYVMPPAEGALVSNPWKALVHHLGCFAIPDLQIQALLNGP